MEVDLWVPVVMAVIAAASTYLVARTPKRQSPEEQRERESELAVAGLAALLNETQKFVSELQEEREHWRTRAMECEQALRSEVLS